MGVTNVSVKISNINQPDKIFEGKFLVDTGAGYTVVPERVWRKLGLKSERE